MRLVILLCSTLAAIGSAEICPCFNFEVGRAISVGRLGWKWHIYSDDCKIEETLWSTSTPCGSRNLECGPIGTQFSMYNSTKSNSK